MRQTTTSIEASNGSKTATWDRVVASFAVAAAAIAATALPVTTAAIALVAGIGYAVARSDGWSADRTTTVGTETSDTTTPPPAD